MLRGIIGETGDCDRGRQAVNVTKRCCWCLTPRLMVNFTDPSELAWHCRATGCQEAKIEEPHATACSHDWCMQDAAISLRGGAMSLAFSFPALHAVASVLCEVTEQPRGAFPAITRIALIASANQYKAGALNACCNVTRQFRTQ